MIDRRERPDRLDFVVGSEIRLRDVLSGEEVMPLLSHAVKAGAAQASLTGTGDEILWSQGNGNTSSTAAASSPIRLEGEEVGSVYVSGEGNSEVLKGIATLLRDAFDVIIRANLKRMLTTEMHTHVVNRSYEDLLETNRRLSISEARYRELAEGLDRKVKERTEELKQAHTRLLQEAKMAAVGQLAAGVAHEINNPIGFIASNLNTLGRYLERFREMLVFYQLALEEDGRLFALKEEARAKSAALRIDFIAEDGEELIAQSLGGTARIAEIVADLKGFSHVDDRELTVLDLNAEIDRTLKVLTPRIPAGAEIVRDFHELPGFRCNPGLMCQVFLNLVLNAIQAKEEGLRLVISTRVKGRQIILRFVDNGPGIHQEILGRIFEPFFTTRDVGAGKGMGLTVSYDIVTHYGGTIEAECKDGEGATFTVILPADGESDTMTDDDGTVRVSS